MTQPTLGRTTSAISVRSHLSQMSHAMLPAMVNVLRTAVVIADDVAAAS